jgi:hypothetical protein
MQETVSTRDQADQLVGLQKIQCHLAEFAVAVQSYCRSHERLILTGTPRKVTIWSKVQSQRVSAERALPGG